VASSCVERLIAVTLIVGLGQIIGLDSCVSFMLLSCLLMLLGCYFQYFVKRNFSHFLVHIF
jgi:hypothetical protein